MPSVNGVKLNSINATIAGSRSGNLLILGGGKCVWQDYLEAKELLDSYDIMCINDIAGQFKAEPITHAVSLHKRILPAVRHLRAEKDMNEDIVTHCDKNGEGVDISWDMPNFGGTSGLFAVKVALILGYTKIIVCGVPIDGTGHYFDPPNADDNDTCKFNDSSVMSPWQAIARKPIPKDRIRSMSGRTAGVFGKPTKEWAVA